MVEERPLVLVVDDHVDIVGLVALHVERMGFRVLTAENGVEALELAVEQRPALLVLDIMMPGLNGYEVVRRLRENPETREIPVILLSARAGGADVQHGLRMGAQVYLRKPFDAIELRDAVRELLGEPPS